MPLWLLKLLPYGLAALALGAAVWFIDHQGYQRAQDQNKLAQARQDIANQKMTDALKDERDHTQKIMGETLIGIDQKLHDQLGNLSVENKTIIQPTLTKEIKSEVRFTDPNAGITDGMLNALNKARAASANSSCTPTKDGGVECPVPPAQPTPR